MRRLFTLLLVLGLCFGPTSLLGGCKEEGPMEKAGKSADKAAKEAEKTAEQAAEQGEEAAEEAQDAAQEAEKATEGQQ